MIISCGDVAKMLKSWMPVLSLSFTSFIFNTSEFIPVGLLSDISSTFNNTESETGMLITVYAWVVSLASLPLMLIFSRTGYKKLMLGLVILFILSNLLSGYSTSFHALMLSRVGVACSHAIFWSMVTPYAIKLAPENKETTAVGLVTTGASVGLIVGLPLGRSIGLVVGWRMTFILIAIFALIVLWTLATLLQEVHDGNRFSLKKLPEIIKSPVFSGILLLTFIMSTGHYTAYSYIEPFLAKVAGMGNETITFVLMIFGMVGILGSYIFSRYYNRYKYSFIRYSICGIALFPMLLKLSLSCGYGIIVIILLWGLAINLYLLIFPTEVVRLIPAGTAVAMSIYSAVYNVGIGAGALIGGVICDVLDVSLIGYIGGGIASLSVFYCLLKIMPELRKNENN